MRISKSAVFLAVAVVAASLTGGASSASASAPGDVEITRVNYNAVGVDTWANRWAEAVYIRAKASLVADLNISGWKVHDTYKNAEGEYTNSYTFPAGTTLKPGALVVVSSTWGVNKSDPAATQQYFMNFKKGQQGHWLNNGGDTVFVVDGGTEVAKFEYDFDNGYYIR